MIKPVSIAIFIAFISALIIAVSAETFLFSEDFEGNISSWKFTTSGSSSSVQVINSLGKYGAFSLHTKSNNLEDNKAYADSPATIFDNINDYKISFYYRTPLDGDSYAGGHWFTIFYNGFVNLIFDNGYGWRDVVCDNAIDGRKVTQQKIDPNRWYFVEIAVHPNTAKYDIYFDGTYVDTCKKFSEHESFFRVGDASRGNVGLGEADYGDGYWDEIKISGSDFLAPGYFFASVISPDNKSYSGNNVMADLSLNLNGTCLAKLNSQDYNMSSTTPKRWSVNFTDLSDGFHKAEFSCQSVSGNISKDFVYFSIDNTSPNITVISPKNQTYLEDFIWINVTTNENSICKYRIDETVPPINKLDTIDNRNFFKKITSLSGIHKINARCNDDAQNFADISEIIFTANVSLVSADLDSDSISEKAENSDSNPANGFENYTDPNSNSNVVNMLDGDGDGRIDFFINTTGGPEPEIYWDPDSNFKSDVLLADQNSDGIKDFVFDSNGDGTKDKWFDPVNSSIGNYTPPPPAPPQQNNQQQGGGPGNPGGISIPLKEEISFTNPPSVLSSIISKSTEFDITISNTGNRKTLIKFNFSGAPTGWFSIFPADSNLSAGETTVFKVKALPQEAGDYDVKITVSGIEDVKELSLKMTVENPKPVQQNATTQTNRTTTTPAPPSGITGAILSFVKNPAVALGAAVFVILGGSIWWSMRSEGLKAARKEEEQIAEKQEPESNADASSEDDKKE